MSTNDSAATIPVSDDLKIAAVAAGCTVAFTLVLRFGLAARNVSFLVRLLPLVPYFLYVFTRRIDLGSLDTVRNWSVLTLLITIIGLGFYAI
ncbi:hypothetical protein C499_05338 [Halogeometricum borinquense DSM 11551]|uniref:DUF8049 domain-containing protein n=2 Tax=Halogeometricum borinquense TaxID=60847 RepID=E4NL01_HALBP|nr:hypothetical protein [Halogeometricum borinquense]ADQ67153.1 hypothetical protein Hbor_15830 [Halogeometricum borinquense DSM 11551]ELY29701.1 hypothetical protein C499_05338 [Halogeometricum borinquense DSM 11551]RYJ13883.1 hypothetical protein ELS19_07825 [Halogeometricum borinquense]